MVDYACDDGVRCDYATSVSPGGLFIETETGLKIGSSVKLRFRLPLHDTLHEIEGRVAWASNDSRDPHVSPGLGIAFTDSDATERLTRELEDLDFE